MDRQRTLSGEASVSGIALHTGVRATLRMRPAPPNSGVVFRRIDLPGKPEIPALAGNVVDVQRGTTIGDGGKVTVHTIEHIMSALHAQKIDNVLVEMDGMEPPICDGSAEAFFGMISRAGVIEQDAPAKYFDVTTPIAVDAGETQLMMSPSEKLWIGCTASFRGCPFDPQYFRCEVTPENYATELSGARTFVQYSDLRQLMAYGLAKGGSLDVAAILHNNAIICKDKLRYQNEIVRHKILDLIGDLYLCGRRVRANIVAVKPGHRFNVELAKKMLQSLNS
ncbi:MAG: UDP-3-O-acyl-N-acetylglucosamine deacetylase [Victivallaceae bacterium]|nr:UDP-3-O-acyl-N-acetylglucosamine deacetylase [Victivallaceae bacterium]